MIAAAMLQGQDPLSYYVNIAGDAMTFSNPNLAAVLVFLAAHEAIIIAPLLIAVAGVLIFTAIWRNTRPDAKPTHEEPPMRRYRVCEGDRVVFEHEAVDVELDDDVLNFIGDVDTEADVYCRVTVACVAWKPEYSVSSVAVEEGAAQ